MLIPSLVLRGSSQKWFLTGFPHTVFVDVLTYDTIIDSIKVRYDTQHITKRVGDHVTITVAFTLNVSNQP